MRTVRPQRGRSAADRPERGGCVYTSQNTAPTSAIAAQGGLSSPSPSVMREPATQTHGVCRKKRREEEEGGSGRGAYTQVPSFRIYCGGGATKLLKLGLVFVVKEPMAEKRSSLFRKAAFHIAICSRPSSRLCSSAKFRMYFAPCTASGEFAAISAASARAPASISSCVSKTLFTNPICRASGALMSRPVKAMSRAIPEPTSREMNCSCPRSGTIAIFVCFMENSTSAVQYRMSRAQARSVPAPMHRLWMAPITGRRQRWMPATALCQRCIIRKTSMLPIACGPLPPLLKISAASLRSSPEQKTFPSALRMATRSSRSWFSQARASRSSPMNPSLIALRALGRHITSSATGPWRSTRRKPPCVADFGASAPAAYPLTPRLTAITIATRRPYIGLCGVEVFSPLPFGFWAPQTNRECKHRAAKK
eukprot:RCo046770